MAGVLQELPMDVQTLACGYQIRRAFEDPVLLKDDRVLQNMLAIEDRYLPSPSYFQCVQTDIESWMRDTVARWMLEVCEEQHCEEEVFPLAMNYMDRYLSAVNIKRTQLQLLAATCMFIASKLKETLPLSAEKLIIYTDYSITLSDLLSWENIVLHRLKWDLSAVTPNDFLEQLISRLPATVEQQKTLRRHSQTFIALCYAADFRFSLYPASMIASACVSTAANGVLGSDWCVRSNIIKQLHRVASIDADCLLSVQEQIEKLLSANLPESNNQESGDEWMPTTPEAGSKIPGQPTTPTDVREVHLM